MLAFSHLCLSRFCLLRVVFFLSDAGHSLHELVNKCTLYIYGNELVNMQSWANEFFSAGKIKQPVEQERNEQMLFIH
jgi:hypothetical protein